MSKINIYTIFGIMTKTKIIIKKYYTLFLYVKIISKDLLTKISINPPNLTKNDNLLFLLISGRRK